jgi:hypothetical protein
MIPQNIIDRLLMCLLKVYRDKQEVSESAHTGSKLSSKVNLLICKERQVDFKDFDAFVRLRNYRPVPAISLEANQEEHDQRHQETPRTS